MQAASATNIAIKMLIVFALAIADTTEALRVSGGLNQSLDKLAGNETTITGLFDDEKHFLSEVQLREYLDEAMSGRQPPPRSHLFRLVHFLS